MEGGQAEWQGGSLYGGDRRMDSREEGDEARSELSLQARDRVHVGAERKVGRRENSVSSLSKSRPGTGRPRALADRTSEACICQPSRTPADDKQTTTGARAIIRHRARSGDYTATRLTRVITRASNTEDDSDPLRRARRATEPIEDD